MTIQLANSINPKYRPLVYFTSVYGAFVAVGLLVGWYTGASNSPVVATLLPLIFGVFGALSYGYLARRADHTKILEQLQAVKLDDDAIEKVSRALSISRSSAWLPAFWSGGVILFCIACYLGTNAGITRRVPEYPPLGHFLQVAGLDASKFNPVEIAMLHNLRWRMRELAIDTSDVEDAFRRVIKPAMADVEAHSWGNREFSLDDSHWWGRHIHLQRTIYDLIGQLTMQGGYVPVTSYRTNSIGPPRNEPQDEADDRPKPVSKTADNSPHNTTTPRN